MAFRSSRPHGSFNSRPHAEVDQKNSILHIGRCLSTHDLTQRSTKNSILQPYQYLPFNSRPHAEVDGNTGIAGIFDESFNSRPHAEVDINNTGAMVYNEDFQLTTSRRGRLIFPSFGIFCPIFQLTTSRRGRRLPKGNHCNMVSFNSRPHAEVDLIHVRIIQVWQHLSTHDLTQRSTVEWNFWMYKCCLSTHDLTQRSTVFGRNKNDEISSFNSRPHAEVDRHWCV